MKVIALLSLALAISVNAQAAKKPKKDKPTAPIAIVAPMKLSKLDQLLKELDTVSLGVSITEVTGETAEEMIQNLATQDDPDMEFQWNREDWPGDEVTWGTFTTEFVVTNQISLDPSSLQNEDGETPDAELEIRNERMNVLIGELAKLGLTFGYNSSGYSYCGVSFSNLLIIDVKNQKIYEVSLGKGGPC